MKRTFTLLILFAMFRVFMVNAQVDNPGAPSIAGATRFMIAGHASVTAVMDSGQNNIDNVNFTAIFLGQLSGKLFFESEIEIGTTSGSAVTNIEQACLVWMLDKNIAFHAGRFIPHFGMYSGRLEEGFINRFVTDPIGFGDKGIGTRQAVGFGLQGGLPLGSSKMNYDLWLSDGPQLLTDANNAGLFNYDIYRDNNKNKAIGGRIGFLPFSNSCLELGISYEQASKTGDQYSIYQNVGVSMFAVDANFYHAIDGLKSTIRLTGEYRRQDADNFDYSALGDTTLKIPNFKNSSSAYYGSIAIRPSGSQNTFIRNLELAFRYSQFITPDGASWAYYDPITGANINATQTAVALDYWLKWNCVIKVCYQIETNVTNKFFVQMFYGF